MSKGIDDTKGELVMLKKEFPILEFDDTKEAVIEPHKIIEKLDIPEYAVMCFFNDVLEKLKNQGKLKPIASFKSEIGENPIYELEYEGRKVVVFNPGVGAPLAAAVLEEAIAMGVNKFIACGGAGVLNREIAVGHLMIPASAVRDEGVSYHYLAPSREIEANKEAVEVIKGVLERHKCKYLISKTWTTDAFYRETPQKVKLRKEEGCVTVEMEAAAFFAVAKFRNVKLGQILYGGDDVSCEEWDSRNWHARGEIREKLFWFAVEACLKL